MSVHTALKADRRRRRSDGPVAVATGRMLRGDRGRHSDSERARQNKNRAEQQPRDPAQAFLHLCPSNLNAKFFRKPLPNLLGQAVVHSPRTFFGRIENRHRSWRGDGYA